MIFDAILHYFLVTMIVIVHSFTFLPDNTLMQFSIKFNALMHQQQEHGLLTHRVHQ